MLYVTKRRHVEAVKWLGDRFEGETPPWVVAALLAEGINRIWRKDSNIHIATERDPQVVTRGSWLVRLDTGKLIAMTGSEFHLTYEVVPEPAGVAAAEDDDLEPTPAPERPKRRHLGLPHDERGWKP